MIGEYPGPPMVDVFDRYSGNPRRYGWWVVSCNGVLCLVQDYFTQIAISSYRILKETRVTR